MVRSYCPKTNKFGLDVAGFEAYFGLKVTGADEPGSGALSRAFLALFTLIYRVFKGAIAAWLIGVAHCLLSGKRSQEITLEDIEVAKLSCDEAAPSEAEVGAYAALGLYTCVFVRALSVGPR